MDEEVNLRNPISVFDIFQDINEPLSIFHLLKGYGLKVCRIRLVIGDYVWGETVVERKFIGDFLTSVYSGRMWTQLGNMRTNYKKCYLILSGTPKDLTHQKFDKEDFIGAIAASSEGYGISPIGVEDDDDLALLVYKLWQRGEKKGKTHRPIPKVRRGASMEERIENMLGQIKKVGPTRAKAILKEFGNIHLTSNASVEELKQIVPPKVAKTVYDTLGYKVKYCDKREKTTSEFTNK